MPHGVWSALILCVISLMTAMTEYPVPLYFFFLLRHVWGNESKQSWASDESTLPWGAFLYKTVRGVRRANHKTNSKGTRGLFDLQPEHGGAQEFDFQTKFLWMVLLMYSTVCTYTVQNNVLYSAIRTHWTSQCGYKDVVVFVSSISHGFVRTKRLW